MELKDFKELVNHKLINDVTYVDHYIKDENAMAELKMEDLASTGILSQPSTSSRLVSEGIGVLPTYGMTIEDFLEMVANGGYVKLESDITLDNYIEIKNDVTIDLNGYTITNVPWEEDGETNAYMFWVKTGKLTLTGNGNVIVPDAVYSMAVWANGGDVEINGGTYKNGGDSCDLVYVSKAGKVEINGGEFVAAGPASGNAPGTKNPYSALNIKDANKSTCSIVVKGGKFFKFNPADNLSENPKMNFVADGYESVMDGDWFVVREVEIEVAE